MLASERQRAETMVEHEDESVGFWLQKPVQLLAETAAVLHRDRRMATNRLGAAEVLTTRRAVAFMFLEGSGVEVGAGDRPWPLPPGVECFYGDVRDGERLTAYFKNKNVVLDRILDAQTFAGVSDSSFDFVISAHVIEHLQDPIGALRATMRVLRTGGVALLAVPDMRHTFDRDRPPVGLDHLLLDLGDGGAGTRLDAYLEHVRYVHPLLTGSGFSDADALEQARQLSDADMDLHFHAWTGDTFKDHLLAIADGQFLMEGHIPVQNENIFLLRKTAG